MRLAHSLLTTQTRYLRTMKVKQRKHVVSYIHFSFYYTWLPVEFVTPVSTQLGCIRVWCKVLHKSCVLHIYTEVHAGTDNEIYFSLVFKPFGYSTR